MRIRHYKHAVYSFCLIVNVLFYVQIVHQTNSDAQMDSASQQATDVMVCLVAPTEVMKSAAVSFNNCTLHCCIDGPTLPQMVPSIGNVSSYACMVLQVVCRQALMAYSTVYRAKFKSMHCLYHAEIIIMHIYGIVSAKRDLTCFFKISIFYIFH